MVHLTKRRNDLKFKPCEKVYNEYNNCIYKLVNNITNNKLDSKCNVERENFFKCLESVKRLSKIVS